MPVPPPTRSARLASSQNIVTDKEDMMSERADFRQLYRDAHAVPNLSEREKIFMGLAVAFVRNCQP